jgi:hypothetical protein
VEAFMTEQGYTWRSAQGQYVLRTEWRENGTSGANRTLISYLVQGEHMELALMRKLDPAAVSRLEKPASNASP